ncbi:unnamed protein product [Cochlearia groenlandica]
MVLLTSTVEEALSPQDGGETFFFTKDRHYAIHGEILMIVLVICFAVFLLLLVLLPCLKRRYTLHHSDLSPGACSTGRLKPLPVLVTKPSIST